MSRDEIRCSWCWARVENVVCAIGTKSTAVPPRIKGVDTGWLFRLLVDAGYSADELEAL